MSRHLDARSTKSAVASPSDIGGTLRTCSPSAARGCRLVASTRVDPVPATISLINEAADSSTCSQLSNTISVLQGCSSFTIGVDSDASTPSARAATTRTASAVDADRRSTNTTRSKSGARRAATVRAKRVLPIPPTPVSVTSSQPARSVATCWLISSRPNPRSRGSSTPRASAVSGRARVDSDRTSPRGRPPTAITCSRSTSGAEGTVPTSSRRHARYSWKDRRDSVTRPMAARARMRCPLGRSRNGCRSITVEACSRATSCSPWLSKTSTSTSVALARSSSSRAASAHAHSSWTNSAYAPPLHMSNARSSDARTSAPAPSSVSAEFTASSNCRWSMRSDTSM